MEPEPVKLKPGRMEQALAAYAGSAGERKAFLAEGENFVGGEAITTDATEGEEQNECHETQEEERIKVLGQ